MIERISAHATNTIGAIKTGVAPMCFGGNPKMPAVAEPVKPQEVKQPAQGAFGSTSTARKNMLGGGVAAGAASTLLTGPSGIENKQLSLGKSTLLGM